MMTGGILFTAAIFLAVAGGAMGCAIRYAAEMGRKKNAEKRAAQRKARARAALWETVFERTNLKIGKVA